MTISATLATPRVRFEADGDVAFIVIDNPPVNAGSAEVRAGLQEAVARLAADPALAAGVLIGAGSSFISGSDIKEFSGPLRQPELPAVIADIEACRKPIVAALHGASFGGGLELSLGCDARIAVKGTLVGLPEVQLGMIPGAGGTQRLPRLAGIARAIELIVSGRRIKAEEAAEYGIIDRLVQGPDQLRSDAAAFARALNGAKRRLRDVAPPEEDSSAIEAAEAAASKGGRIRSNAREAIASIKRAASVPFDDALGEERAIFQRLRLTEEAAALRYNFFAERAAAKIEGAAEHPSRPIRNVGILGAGTMGSGIAAVFAAAGFSITLTDVNREALDRAPARIAQAIGDLVRSGKLEAENAAAIGARVSYAADLQAVSDADLLVEAVFEELSVKTNVMKTLGGLAKKGAVIATNTSYIDVDELAAASGRAEDVIGLHFFAPAHKMRLVEVVRGTRSLPDAANTGMAVAKALGKLAIMAGACEGFIGNRIYSRYRSQCEYMLQEGALPQEIDAAVEAMGFAMGVFAVSDLSGLDIAWMMRKRKSATRDPRERYVPIADRLCEMGRLGRKTGAGWYDYQGVNSGRGKIDPLVTQMVRDEAARYGPARSFSEKDIQRRVLGTIVNEAALILSEGMARSAAEIDLVLVNGYGFSKYHGGPLFLASRLDSTDVEAMIDEVEQAVSFGFRRGDVQLLS